MLQIARAAKRIAGEGYDIVYVCHCPDDRRFIKYLKQEKVNYEFCDMTDWHPMQSYLFYNNIELVVGMRGHAQMIPFGLNCRIISLGTHKKMRWFLDDIDAQDWYIDLRVDTDSLEETIVKKFIDINIVNADITTQRIMDAQKQLFDITKANMQTISSILSS